MKTDHIFKEQILQDIRSHAFKIAVRFVNYEVIPGDICEFGCYTGRSLAMLAYYHENYWESENTHNSKNFIKRQVYGFDSFEGLPSSEAHPRWNKGLFGVNHSYHPTIAYGEPVTPEKVYNYFSSYELPRPIIKRAHFDKLHPDDVMDIEKIAILHVDCDLYSSTQKVFELVKDKLVPGSIILLDDWYNFKAHPDKGERRAFEEFLTQNRHIECEEFLRYGTFCKAFVVIRITDKDEQKKLR